ncbi:DNA topoisomerase (ATP-hydrolyzing) subunit B [Candidatus Azambacteria bacterium]|nr:DNA topoisomerase (ATP-hydrolyzing) subunit B [Candidatus Azambacteria bacterium]
MAKEAKGGKTQKDPRYSAEDIYVLEGLEPVRKRPGMYIGSTGPDGLHHLVWEIFDNSRDEAMGGYATQIEVALLPGNVIRVADDGRGIPVDIHPKTKVSALETAMTTLHAGGKFGGESYKISGGLHGVGASVVNALSTWLKAEVHRDGGKHFQEYKQGKPKAKVKKVASSKKRGTIITFSPDPEIFKEIAFDFQKIKDHHRQQAFLVKGMRVRIIDAREYKGKISEDVYYIDELHLPVPSYAFYFEGGILSLVRHLNKDEEVLHDAIFYVDKQADGVFVEASLQYLTDITAREISFANNIHTPEGGMHLTGFRSALTRVLNDYARKNNILREADDNLSGEDVREGLTAVISVKIPNPQFEGQTKAKLGSPEGRTATESVIGEALAYFLEEHPQDARRIIEKCVLSQKARKAAKAARETVLRKGILEGMTLPGKLADCSSRDPEESELYIVEGDSAGGCFDGDTKIALTDGRNITMKELTQEHGEGKKNYCYTIMQDGTIGIGEVKDPRITKKEAEVVEVMLDSGENIVCTLDHRFMLRNGEYKQAQHLVKGDALMPFRRQYSRIGKRITIEGYELVFDPRELRWIFTHMLSDRHNIARGVYLESHGAHKHHLDFNKHNNNPDNITRLTKDEHLQLHRQFAAKTLHRPEVFEKLKVLRRNPEFRDKIKRAMLSPRMRSVLSARAKKQWENEEYKKFMGEKFLEFYRTHPEYREKNSALLFEAQRAYWSKEENRKKHAERVRRYFEAHPDFKEAFSEFSKKQWQNENLLAWRSEKTKEQWTQEFRKKRKEAYNKTYREKGLTVLRRVFEQQGSLNEAAYNDERKKLRDRSVLRLSTLVERFFDNDKERLKEAVRNFNHKVEAVTQLRKKIDVYDFEVPGTHNFALSSGVFVHNSAKQGRDRRFQAILPLKGKILNIEKARLDRMLTSSEIKALIIALGTAIADEFDAARLRYHRVIIMTDADVDGAHIRTLLLTLFYRYFAPLIDAGNIYIAQPPLYRIQSGKAVKYAYSDKEKEGIVGEFATAKQGQRAAKSKKEAKGEKEEAAEETEEEAAEEKGEEKVRGVSIQRYKGLGEMNPDQLWATTMDPTQRMVKRVMVADAQEADKIFSVLMGSDVLPRKRFIQAHAKNVKNLDV